MPNKTYNKIITPSTYNINKHTFAHTHESVVIRTLTEKKKKKKKQQSTINNKNAKK